VSTVNDGLVSESGAAQKMLGIAARIIDPPLEDNIRRHSDVGVAPEELPVFTALLG
jgi:hypothetical protein